MNGYSPKDIIREPIVVGASETALQVSKDSGLTAGGALQGFRVDFKVSAVTAATGITVKLQQRTIDAWTDIPSASIAVSGNGELSIKKHFEASPSDFPLQKQMRAVVTTGAGDAVTFDKMFLLQEI